LTLAQGDALVKLLIEKRLITAKITWKTVHQACGMSEGLEPDRAMNLGDYLIWEATNGLLLIPIVTGLVMLVRCPRSQRVLFVVPKWLGVRQ
jgi:hypothetical protein